MCNFIKKKRQHRCFPVNIAKFLRTAFCLVFCWLVHILTNKLTFYIRNCHQSSLITDSVNSCLTTNVLVRMAVCSARDALLGIVSIHEAGQIYVGQRIQAKKMRLFGAGHSEQDMQLYGAIRSEAQLSGVPHSEYRHYPEPGFV